MMKTITPSSQKALILSGSSEISQSVKNSLKSFQYGNIESIENGIEALRKMNGVTYDLIVCHNKVKFISGWNLIKELKTSEKIPNMPVVLFGELPAPAPADELKAYGLVQYLKSPPSEADLTFLVNSTLQLFKTSGTIENKYTKAKAALIAHQSDQAVELYSELHGLTKRSLRSSLGLAEAFTQSGNIEKAEALLAETLKTDSQNATLAILQIKLLLTRRQFAEAQATGLNLLLPYKDSPFYHARILTLYNEAKVLEQAEHVCRDAMTKGFKIPEFSRSMARIQFQKGDYQTCLKTLEDSIAQHGANVEMLNIKGACLRKQNLLDQALGAYADALKISPMDSRVYFNMALCSIAKKSIRDAKQQLEMCLKITPDFPNARAKLDEVEKFLKTVA